VADISCLHHQEGVRLDPVRLVALYAELGEARAEVVIGRAMEELAAKLLALQRVASAQARAPVIAGADQLCALAAQVGMTSLVDVGHDVAACAQAGDAAALAATLARLVRIGDRSLTAVWDLQDMSL